MSRILQEVQAAQNPALGGSLLWRFVCGYSPDTSANGTPLPLAFLVLPLVLHARSLAAIRSTKIGSGLRKLEEKLTEHSDEILLVSSRALSMRPLTLRSLRLALRTGLLTMVAEDAVLWPRTYSKAPAESAALRHLLDAAERLGTWCSELTLFEICGILRVEF